MRTLLVCAMMAVGAGVAIAQPVQWRVEDGGNGHWYDIQYWPGLVDWESARQSAHGAGGHLVTIRDAAEQAFVAGLAVSRPSVWGYGDVCGPWIGVYSPVACSGGNSCLRTVTGEVVEYSNWGSGAPNDVPFWPAYVCLWERVRDGGSWQDFRASDGPGFASDGVHSALVEWSADCNNDGIVDKGQILSGELIDANNNGIPDWSVSITRQPTNQAVGVDQPVFFVVEASSAAGCAEPLSYRWQRRNPQVLDDGAPDAWIDLQDGGGFLNAATASLTILRPTAGLATGYRCRLSGGCGCEGVANGVAYTDTVNFAAACPSDFNNDGSVDGDDVIEFFERWDGGC